MLREIVIRAFAVIDELHIPLGPGLSVVTGETGAGKSLLVDALGLAVGERGDSDVIRTGAAQAEITARFLVTAASPADLWLAERDLADEGGECIVRRVIARDRSRAYVNARPVPLQQLRELGDRLVELHGQHEHQALLRKDVQRDLLDAYAAALPERAALASAVTAWRAAEARLRALAVDAEAREARAALLRYQLEELTVLAPENGEWDTLSARHKRLAHAQELASGVATLRERLTDGDQALAQALETHLHLVRELARHEPRLTEVETLLASASVEIHEAGLALNRMGSTDETEEGGLATVEARLARWHELARKHHVPPEDLPALWADLKAEQAALGEGADTDALNREIATRAAEARDAAERLSAKRRAAGTALNEAVTAEMRRLGLGDGRFAVALNAADLNPNGCEDVEFLVSASPEGALRPLAKVASGGELSRISLALQVVLAAEGSGPTLVFDEVDVGIGGAVAEIVGQRLRALAKTRQVLCVTHLPQVAAQGDNHLLVHKDRQKGQTLSSVEILTRESRVEELARMLGGVSITPRTRALARDMLHG